MSHGETIRARRRAHIMPNGRPMTRADVARVSGLSARQVQLIEEGRALLADEIPLLVQAIPGLTVADLVGVAE